MKQFMKLALLAAAFLTFNSATVFAQKYGHLNSGNLIEMLPETKAANTQLKTLQDQLVKKGQDMAKKFEADYLAFAQEYQGGNVTPAVAQAKEEEFRKKQAEIAQYEQKVVADVSKKRDELFTPILQKIQEAIDSVGKEGNYAMIFDTSILAGNPIVFAADADDVLAQVKAKLGL